MRVHGQNPAIYKRILFFHLSSKLLRLDNNKNNNNNNNTNNIKFDILTIRDHYFFLSFSYNKKRL